MISVNWLGRLGNNMIQYAAGYILSKNTGLRLITQPVTTYENTEKLKTTCSDEPEITVDFSSSHVVCNTGKEIHNKTIKLDDRNYFTFLNKPDHDTGYTLNGFFQDGRLLCEYRDTILKLYNYKYTPNLKITSNDMFIAARFGDCLSHSRTYCTINYIDQQLKKSQNKYSNIYLSSDSLNYQPLIKLIEKYDMRIYNSGTLDTVLFASCFNNLILSAGSFSYWMAYLGSADNITLFVSKNHKHDPLLSRGAWSYNPNINFYNE